MREKTYHLYLNEEERSRVIQSLIDLKNNLAAQGRFKNDIFGDYIRYTHASCYSYVVVNIDGKILVVNGENDAETKEIYQRISEKVSKERI